MDKTYQIPPGIYRLARSVRNPHPDLRKTRDWRSWPEWEAGMVFVVDPPLPPCDTGPADRRRPNPDVRNALHAMLPTRGGRG